MPQNERIGFCLVQEIEIQSEVSEKVVKKYPYCLPELKVLCFGGFCSFFAE